LKNYSVASVKEALSRQNFLTADDVLADGRFQRYGQALSYLKLGNKKAAEATFLN
jgi:hypothetical protein